MITRALLLLALVLTGGSAHAFVTRTNANGQVLKWDLVNLPASVHTNVVNRNTKAIRYFLASDGFSTTNTAAELNAVRSCFDQWQSFSGTHLKYEDAGLIGTGADINPNDNTNVVYWVKDSTTVSRNNNPFSIGGALGFTSFSFTSDNILVEADIVLNGNLYSWFTDITDTNNPAFFVDGTLLHEIGHSLGLLHSPVGGASMLTRSGNGTGSIAIGLSEDEKAAIRTLYPAAGQANSAGTIRGVVNKINVGPVFGAVITAENSAGNVIAGAVSQPGGLYSLYGMPPGNYQVRVTPLDPPNGTTLLRGSDIDFTIYSGADTAFLPSEIKPVTVTGGATTVQDFGVTNGTPAFFISHLRPATSNPNAFSIVNSPIAVRPGQANITVGVYGSTLPANGATLAISGDGITAGAITFNNVFNGINGISVLISVAANATPGLRSFLVTRTSDSAKAYANGFIEVLPPVMDNNFDGVDDIFQRANFPLFTSPQAGPTANPDGDAYNNLAESIAGSNPNDVNSFLQILSTTQNAGGTTITWSSAAGKKYLILSREQIVGAQWSTNAASPVVGTGPTTQFTDSPVSGAVKFYRVQAVQ